MRKTEVKVAGKKELSIEQGPCVGLYRLGHRVLQGLIVLFFPAFGGIIDE